MQYIQGKKSLFSFRYVLLLFAILWSAPSRSQKVSFFASCNFFNAQIITINMYFNFSGDVAYTCETAGYFFLYQIQSRWEKFLSQVTGKFRQSLPCTYFKIILFSRQKNVI